MLKSAVDDGAQDFRLQEEVAESRAVNGNISSLHIFFGPICRLRSHMGIIFLLVVEEISVSNVGFGHFKTEINLKLDV